MKKIILITMLMSAVFAQSDCNESNWQEYYNSDGKDMSECDLRGANLIRANLKDANLKGANLSDALLGSTLLIDANLTDANLTDALLNGAFLTGAFLNGALLNGALLSFANLTGANLTGANLTDANLLGSSFIGANLDGVISNNIIELPLFLPDGWSLVDGTLIEDEEKEAFTNRELSDEIYNTINEGKPINRSKWRAWEKENDPQVSKGKTTFKTLDKNMDGKIGTGEFFKFYQRWIQD
jgi:uncharacterized protein YjbI with pentapeptide repeats